MNDAILLKAFDDVVWMAIRYASGRSSYAPSMVREAVANVQSVYPDWKPKPDKTIGEGAESWGGLKSDWLNDLFKESK